MIPLLVVCGPTASGKTALAASLAAALGGEVIGADSMQVYKGCDIATAKPTEAEMRGAPHHLIDFLDPRESFSVADYVRLAKPVIRDIANRSRLPILCGGTGLYISSLVDNIAFEAIEVSDIVRENLKRLAREKGAEYLHARLKEIDPPMAEKLHANNLGRVIRALEAYEATGERMSALQERARQASSEYDALMLGITYRSRERLYERVNQRIDGMLARGLLEEAKAALENGPQNESTFAQAIGYKEFRLYFEGLEDLSAAVERLKRSTRRYAKRQLTWFRRERRVIWLYRDDYGDDNGLLQAALETIGDSKWESSPKKS
jgi:tRNA dimethylallyltransferase